jgi:hypothetical protein
MAARVREALFEAGVGIRSFAPTLHGEPAGSRTES